MHIIAVIAIIGIIYILGQGLHFGDAIIRKMNINSIIRIIKIGNRYKRYNMHNLLGLGLRFECNKPENVVDQMNKTLVQYS